MIFRTNGVEYQISEYVILSLAEKGINLLYEVNKAAEEATINKLTELCQDLVKKEQEVADIHVSKQ